MDFRDLLLTSLLFFDGAMGTMLQQAGLEPGEIPDCCCLKKPEAVRAVHEAYLEAGCNILKTNTFGTNSHKLEGSGYSVSEISTKAVELAKEAIAAHKGQQHKFVAFDVGPTGKLLEPLGDLKFEDAVSLFGEAVSAGAKAGADLVLIETMSDTYELKAAVLAAKECSSLPICATVTLDKNERLLTGGELSAVVALLEGLGVDALGLNCGLGPLEMLPVLKKLRKLSSLPLILNPNAGLPKFENGKTVYSLSPEEFEALMYKAAAEGAQLLGGCCGTTPAHLKALVLACRGLMPKKPEYRALTVASSGIRAVYFGASPVLIGERINPTGKPALKQALLAGETDYILKEALGQQVLGVQALDVNVGLPGLDEPKVLLDTVKNVQSVCELPLQLDSANPKAFELSMRHYNGKPIINSVNGKKESMSKIFPLVKKYGGLIVALTLDENGIPKSAKGRLEIAKRIVETAHKYGIQKKDLLFDTLIMAQSAEDNNACVTLEALRLIKNGLGVKTILGVSNISFGLPSRELLNAAFLTLALGAGLDAALINPYSAKMLDAFKSAALLLGYDPKCAEFIKYYSSQSAPDAPKQKPKAPKEALYYALKHGLKTEAAEAAACALETEAPLSVIETSLMPALNEIGMEYENGSLFLPQLLLSAEAAKAAFEQVHKRMDKSENADKGVVVLATVEGDVHDIGKNIVKALLENYCFRVIDLGKDVPIEAVLEAVALNNARLAGLSALMTTTVPSMEATITELHKCAPECRIMVGGAVLSEGYAKKIGADFYGKNAMAAVHYAQKVYSS